MVFGAQRPSREHALVRFGSTALKTQARHADSPAQTDVEEKLLQSLRNFWPLHLQLSSAHWQVSHNDLEASRQRASQEHGHRAFADADDGEYEGHRKPSDGVIVRNNKFYQSRHISSSTATQNR
jgi:hypothetical protein